MDLLVSTAWLSENANREDVKILDGTWVLPADEDTLARGYIPGAQVFDIDAIADTYQLHETYAAKCRRFR